MGHSGRACCAISRGSSLIAVPPSARRKIARLAARKFHASFDVLPPDRKQICGLGLASPDVPGAACPAGSNIVDIDSNRLGPPVCDTACPVEYERAPPLPARAPQQVDLT